VVILFAMDGRATGAGAFRTTPASGSSIYRSAIGAVATILSFLTPSRELPLADANALSFHAGPCWIVPLGRLSCCVEKIGPARIGAALIGFCRRSADAQVPLADQGPRAFWACPSWRPWAAAAMFAHHYHRHERA